MDTVIIWIKAALGAALTVLTMIFGGLDAVLAVLLMLMALDYATGVWSAVINGEVSSRVGFTGLLKKMVILAVVAVGHLIGHVAGMPEIRSFVIGFYIANEGISILENAGQLGVPLPKKLIEVLECLKEKNQE